MNTCPCKYTYILTYTPTKSKIVLMMRSFLFHTSDNIFYDVVVSCIITNSETYSPIRQHFQDANIATNPSSHDDGLVARLVS